MARNHRKYPFVTKILWLCLKRCLLLRETRQFTSTFTKIQIEIYFSWIWVIFSARLDSVAPVMYAVITQSLFWTIHRLHSAYTFLRILLHVHCTMYILYNVYCIVYTLYIIHNTFLYTLYNVHSCMVSIHTCTSCMVFNIYT